MANELSCVSVSDPSSRPSYGADDNEIDDMFWVLHVGPSFKYVIPSFDVLTVELRHIRVGGDSNGAGQVYDIFIRGNDLSLMNKVYPALMTAKDYMNIAVEEFALSVNTKGLKLPPHGITVVWNWEWDDAVEDNDSQIDPESMEQMNPYVHSDTESVYESDNEISIPTQIHTVTFKCVGSTYDTNAQSILFKASKLLKDSKEVPAKLQPEPTNQYDARAIAFMCEIDMKWHRIGYVVHECLEHVHKAMAENNIAVVKLSWAKYLVCWSRSGPGYYAGVNISLKGEWHRDVIRHQSTR